METEKSTVLAENFRSLLDRSKASGKLSLAVAELDGRELETLGSLRADGQFLEDWLLAGTGEYGLLEQTAPFRRLARFDRLKFLMQTGSAVQKAQAFDLSPGGAGRMALAGILSGAQSFSIRTAPGSKMWKMALGAAAGALACMAAANGWPEMMGHAGALLGLDPEAALKASAGAGAAAGYAADGLSRFGALARRKALELKARQWTGKARRSELAAACAKALDEYGLGIYDEAGNVSAQAAARRLADAFLGDRQRSGSSPEESLREMLSEQIRESLGKEWIAGRLEAQKLEECCEAGSREARRSRGL